MASSKDKTNSARKTVKKSQKKTVKKSIKKPVTKAVSKAESKARKTPKKVTRKVASRKTPAATISDNVVEKKLEEMMTPEPQSVSKPPVKKQNTSFWWQIVFVILIVIFGAMLLYENNDQFRENFDKLKVSMGWPASETTYVDENASATSDPFLMKLDIIYNENDADMKTAIDRFVDNVESRIENTKVSATWIDKNESKAQAIIQKLNAKSLPIILTDKTILDHPDYSLFAPAIKQVDDEYLFYAEGMEYLETPEIGDSIYFGNEPDEAKVTIIEFVSMSCGYCKAMHPILETVLEEYGNDVSLVVKHFDRGGIDSMLAQAVDCAEEQNVSWQMMSALYERQADVFSILQAQDDVETKVMDLVEEAALEARANSSTLVQCIEEEKYQDKVVNDTELAQEFGILGTPAFFINDQFLGGATDEETFKSIIEEELNKQDDV